VNKLLFKAFSAAHVWLYRSSGGKRGSTMGGKPILLLTTTGRKTGEQRTVPVMTFEDGGDRFVVASKGGSPAHPAWFLNLEKNPDVTVQLGSDVYRAKAVITEPAERDRLFRKIVGEMPQFGEYEKKTTRVIPVVRLVRAG
jgi:deazaflavin-dependent oxidoreductase (nitroreductase family)